MTRPTLSELGYTFSLHRVGEDPEAGFGYKASEEEEVRKECDLWNSWTPETCPHKGFLEGRSCMLCGNKYAVTKLGGGGV